MNSKLGYPFGKRRNGISENKYLYNGKELQEELDIYDYWPRFEPAQNVEKGSHI